MAIWFFKKSKEGLRKVQNYHKIIEIDPKFVQLKPPKNA